MVVSKKKKQPIKKGDRINVVRPDGVMWCPDVLVLDVRIDYFHGGNGIVFFHQGQDDNVTVSETLCFKTKRGAYYNSYKLQQTQNLNDE